MSTNNKQLREGIITKLKEYEAYVDNELPDYIMVMLANNKTVHQINNDLQLFLGENTDRFTAWLQRAMSDTSALTEPPADKVERKTAQQEKGGEPVQLAGIKRQRSEEEEELIELEDYDDDWERESGPPTPPLEVAEAMVKAKEKRQKEREKAKEKEKGERGSQTKIVKLSADDSKSGGQKSHVVVKKVIKVLQPPDSSRDQDLRELIAQRRKEKARHDSPQRKKRKESGGEVKEEGEDSSDGEGDSQVPTASIPSVVKLVHTERPKRTNKGGSRLLHRAILGIKPIEKKASKLQERGKEKEETQAPPTRIRGSSSNKHSTTSPGQSLEQDDNEAAKESGEAGDGGEGGDEVLVEVAEEGATTKGNFVDEFRQEQRLEKSKTRRPSKDEIEKSTIAAVQKVLPLRGRLRLTGLRTAKNSKVLRSLVRERRSRERSEKDETSEEEREKEEKEIDLREILNNKKTKKNSESSTRFVVTLSGVGDDYPTTDSLSDSDLDKESNEVKEEQGVANEGGVRELQKAVLTMSRRYNSQAIEAATTSQKFTNQDQDLEQDYEEDHGDGYGLSGLPERCRFWPNCKNGDTCPFHHPSAACRLFPNCKYGNKCHFIHPQCKFDARCTRADCPYLHTAPRHLAFSSSAMAPAPVPAPMIAPPIFTPFSTRQFKFGRSSPWQQSQRPQRYPSKSALSWTPAGKGSHVSERQFAVPDEQTSALPV